MSPTAFKETTKKALRQRKIPWTFLAFFVFFCVCGRTSMEREVSKLYTQKHLVGSIHVEKPSQRPNKYVSATVHWNWKQYQTPGTELSVAGHIARWTTTAVSWITKENGVFFHEIIDDYNSKNVVGNAFPWEAIEVLGDKTPFTLLSYPRVTTKLPTANIKVAK